MNGPRSALAHTTLETIAALSDNPPPHHAPGHDHLVLVDGTFA